MQRQAILFVLAAAVAASACASRPVARASIPRAASPQKLSIFLRDADLPNDYKLENTAVLALAAPDLVMVRVRNASPTPEVADPEQWTVWLEDAAGRRLDASSRREASHDRLAVAWKRERDVVDRTFQRRVRKLIPRLDAFQGEAVYAFEAPKLGEAEVLTLVVRRADLELRYVWRFGAAEAVLEPWGRTAADDAGDTLVVPGLVTKRAARRLRPDLDLP